MIFPAPPFKAGKAGDPENVSPNGTADEHPSGTDLDHDVRGNISRPFGT
jgi:hypothetical protein